MKTEYQVVYCYTCESLAKTVEVNIEMGWRPIGGVAVYWNDTQAKFYQAMVRETGKPRPTFAALCLGAEREAG